MKRVFLALLLVALATLLVPGLRERAQPRIDAGRERLGEVLEGPLSPLLIPYRTMKTKDRIGEALRLLIRNRNRGRDAPTPDAFRAYLEDAEIEAIDGWGAPFIINQGADSITVRSAGADMEYETDDDITERVRYSAPQPQWRRRR